MDEIMKNNRRVGQVGESERERERVKMYTRMILLSNSNAPPYKQKSSKKVPATKFPLHTAPNSHKPRKQKEQKMLTSMVVCVRPPPDVRCPNSTPLSRGPEKSICRPPSQSKSIT